MVNSSIEKVVDKYKNLEDKSIKYDKGFKYQVNLRLNFSNEWLLLILVIKPLNLICLICFRSLHDPFEVSVNLPDEKITINDITVGNMQLLEKLLEVIVQVVMKMIKAAVFKKLLDGMRITSDEIVGIVQILLQKEQKEDIPREENKHKTESVVESNVQKYQHGETQWILTPDLFNRIMEDNIDRLQEKIEENNNQLQEKIKENKEQLQEKLDKHKHQLQEEIIDNKKQLQEKMDEKNSSYRKR